MSLESGLILSLNLIFGGFVLLIPTTAPVSAMSVTLVLPIAPLLIMTMVFCLPVRSDISSNLLEYELLNIMNVF